ncbi:MAG TPA: 4-(cytidine 5'-diphospho)-2-C-methyl-D-erythritol kinase [Gemmatimonadaceae bacterium]|nr:4-(cytidine 5'-diphospho)-2-C-methyl-D-erythritol kinase [Gemmatimonadaceae bacterium]
MSARAARVTAHAKINLGLRILAREAGGYHGLETVFARIALGDLLTVRVDTTGRSLDCAGADVGPTERNLAWRAALAFADATGWPRGFAIELRKCVPVGGGLGGGSADAGAVLRALAALAPHAPSEEELLRLAISLGSDVPFLTLASPMALAWGRGERMLRLSPLPERPVALVSPDFAVSTADAYAWLAASRGAWAPQPLALDADALGSWESLAPLVTNDFEVPVSLRHPEIARIIDGLHRAGASIARLSGSGSTVFGIFPAPPVAEALARELPGRVMLTRTLERVTPVELVE